MIDAIQWFDLQSESERMLVLKALAHMCLQSSPLIKDILDAISQSGLSPASMACEILKRTRPIADAIYKIAEPPEAEQVNSFHLLISLFAISDERRRVTKCKNGCGHDWHNLSTAST